MRPVAGWAAQSGVSGRSGTLIEVGLGHGAVAAQARDVRGDGGPLRRGQGGPLRLGPDADAAESAGVRAVDGRGV